MWRILGDGNRPVAPYIYRHYPQIAHFNFSQPWYNPQWLTGLKKKNYLLLPIVAEGVKFSDLGKKLALRVLWKGEMVSGASPPPPK